MAARRRRRRRPDPRTAPDSRRRQPRRPRWRRCRPGSARPRRRCRCRGPARRPGGRRHPRRGRPRRTARRPCITGRPPASGTAKREPRAWGAWTVWAPSTHPAGFNGADGRDERHRPGGGARRRACSTRSEADTTRSERRRADRLGRLLADDAGRALLFALTDEVLRTPDAEPGDGRSSRELVGRRPPDVAAPASTGSPCAWPPSAPGRHPRRSPPSSAAASAPRPAASSSRPPIRPSPATSPPGRRPGSTSTSTSSARRSSATTRRPAGSTPSCARIRRPDVDYVSVKISALCAGLDVLAFEHEVGAHRRSPARRLRRRRRAVARPSSSTSTWRSTATST